MEFLMFINVHIVGLQSIENSQNIVSQAIEESGLKEVESGVY